MILRRRGAIDPNDTAVFEDFRVHRNHIQQWLNYLRVNHPTFQNPNIQIDDDIIQQLPEDELVHNDLLNLTTSEIDSEEDQGPPEDSDNQPPTTLHSEGFVPDLHIGMHEIDQLCNAAHPPIARPPIARPPQKLPSSLHQLCMVLHFLSMGQTLQSMHSQHSFLLAEVVLMNQDNMRYLRKIGQTTSFNSVVGDLLGTHTSNTRH